MDIQDKKLNLGCGMDKKEGYINCDISPLVKPDKILDLEKKLPFKSNSIKEVYTRHTLEHIKDITGLMKELHRICKKDAKIKIIVPYFSHMGAYQDPTHKRFFTLKTFDYFEKGNVLCLYNLGLFKIEKKELAFFISKPLIGSFLGKIYNNSKVSQKIYERFFAHIIPATELRIILRVIK